MIGGIQPYAERKDSGVAWLGDVPAHWEVRPALAVYRPRQVKNLGLTEKTVLSLSYGRVVIKPEEKLRGLVPESFETYQIVEPGNIIIRTTDLQNDQKSLRIGHAKDRGVITSAYMCVETTSKVENEFGYQYLNAYDLLKIIYGYGSGLRQNLDFKDIKRMPVLVPPKDEQTAIVRFLDHADRRIRRAIAVKQKLIKLLEEQKQAIIHRAVTRGLDPDVRLKPSGVEWLGDVPEHWDVSKIRHFARVGNGSTPSRGRADYWSGGTFPWLNSSVANRAVVKESDQFVTQIALRECHLPILQPGSVLVAITGQGKTRGKAALLETEATINQHLAYISLRGESVTPTFLRSVLTASYTTLRSISDDSGSTKGALTCADLRHFKVPVPPLIEQAALVDWIEMQTSAADDVVDRAGREIELLSEYRTRLIADVVTGKLDVREAAARLPREIEPVDAALDDEFTSDEESDPIDTDDEAKIEGVAA